MLNDTFRQRKEADEEVVRELRKRMEGLPEFIAIMRRFALTLIVENLCDDYLAKRLKDACDVLEDCSNDLDTSVKLFNMYLHLNYENAENLERILYPTALEGRHTRREWESLVSLCGDRCVLCGVHRSALRGGTLTKDHIISQRFNERTSDHITNIQPLCQRCNTRKRFIVGLEGVDLVLWSVRCIMREQFA